MARNFWIRSLGNIGHPLSNYAYGMGWGSASSDPLDLFKLTVGEGGIRAPLLIGGPGIKGRRQITTFACVRDIMPTLLEFVGLPHPQTFNGHKVERMRGRSMRDLLAGKAVELYGPEEFVGGELGDGKWMRQGDFKAVSVAKPYGDGTWHLYNLASDPRETRNLAEQKPKLLKQLRTAWDRYATDVGIVRSE